MRKAGFVVRAVENAGDALRAMHESTPDLVMTDTKLPGMDGFSLVSKIREEPKFSSLSLMFVSSDASLDAKVRGLELGVEYVTKPVYIKEVITRVRLQLDRRYGPEGPPSEKARMQGSLEDMGVVDLLQSVDAGRKTGVLYVSSGRNRGVIYFREGQVLDAQAGDLRRETAVYRILTWGYGDFEVDFREVRDEPQITTPTRGLLMEGMRRIDEWDRLVDGLPPLTTVMEVDGDRLLDYLSHIPDKVNTVLRHFDGRRSLEHVIDLAGQDPLETLAALQELVKGQLLLAVNGGVVDPGRSYPSDPALNYGVVPKEGSVEVPSKPPGMHQPYTLVPGARPSWEPEASDSPDHVPGPAAGGPDHNGAKSPSLQVESLVPHDRHSALTSVPPALEQAATGAGVEGSALPDSPGGSSPFDRPEATQAFEAPVPADAYRGQSLIPRGAVSGSTHPVDGSVDGVVRSKTATQVMPAFVPPAEAFPAVGAAEGGSGAHTPGSELPGPQESSDEAGVGSVADDENTIVGVPPPSVPVSKKTQRGYGAVLPSPFPPAADVEDSPLARGPSVPVGPGVLGGATQDDERTSPGVGTLVGTGVAEAAAVVSSVPEEEATMPSVGPDALLSTAPSVAPSSIAPPAELSDRSPFGPVEEGSVWNDPVWEEDALDLESGGNPSALKEDWFEVAGAGKPKRKGRWVAFALVVVVGVAAWFGKDMLWPVAGESGEPIAVGDAVDPATDAAPTALIPESPIGSVEDGENNADREPGVAGETVGEQPVHVPDPGADVDPGDDPGEELGSVVEGSGGASSAEVDALLERARTARGKKQLTLLREAVALDGDREDAVGELAFRLLAAGRNREAAEHADRATRLNPKDARAWVTLGAALQGMGERFSAQQAYRSCVEQGEGPFVKECRPMVRR